MTLHTNSLDGKHILLTRPEALCKPLKASLENAQAGVLLFPTLAITPPKDTDSLHAGIEALEMADYAIFISPSAVMQSAPLIKQYYNGLPIETKFLAQGSGTAKALKHYGYESLIPNKEPYNSETLLAMPELASVENKIVVFFTGLQGRNTIPQTLKNRGASVLEAIAYERVCPDLDVKPLMEAFNQEKISLIISTSSESLKNLIFLLSKEGLPFFQTTPLLVVNDAMEKIARENGHTAPIIRTKTISDEGIFEEILGFFN